MIPTSSPPTRKLLLMQQFISLLLIFRLHLTQLPALVYYIIIVAFFAGKYKKQGNTAGSVLQYISMLIILAGDILQNNQTIQIGIIVAVLNYIFVAPTVYTLPEYPEKVGLRDNYAKRNGKELYWAQWFPIVQNQKMQLYKIAWNHTVEINKMASYMGIKGKFMETLFKFFTSHTSKYQLTFAKGDPKQQKSGVILFSHGRTGTPFLYSSILKKLATNWRILSPQHSQVKQTPYTDLKDIKRYREVQVKERSEQIVYLASKIPENQRIVLMGHSYGCATVLQAYHDLHLAIRKRVSQIVLLDPWLFPLTTQIADDEIVCPILILANQHFINIEDVYNRNKAFLKRHGSKVTYFCWRGGDHLHQTDMPFIVGTSLRKIKNAKECNKHLKINNEAIEMFLNFKKMDIEEIGEMKEKFGEFDLSAHYKPEKWNPRFNF